LLAAKPVVQQWFGQYLLGALEVRYAADPIVAPTQFTARATIWAGLALRSDERIST
jgi:hypothetical protein